MLNWIDLEKNGKDNAAFKGSVDQISMATAKPVEEEKVDEKTLAENEKRAAEGITKKILMYRLKNIFSFQKGKHMNC